MRWSQDKDSLSGNVASFVSLNGGATSPSCIGGTFCFVPVSSNAAATIAASQANYVAAPATTKDTSLVDYRAVVEYTPKLDFTDSTFIYASYSRGSKPGNLNLVPATVPVGAIPLTFQPEELQSYEVGLKNTLLDGTLQANLDAWYYNYENYQLGIIVARQAVDFNIPAHLYGMEGEFVWQPQDDLAFNLTLSLTRSAAGNAVVGGAPSKRRDATRAAAPLSGSWGSISTHCPRPS